MLNNCHDKQRTELSPPREASMARWLAGTLGGKPVRWGLAYRSANVVEAEQWLATPWRQKSERCHPLA